MAVLPSGARVDYCTQHPSMTYFQFPDDANLPVRRCGEFTRARFERNVWHVDPWRRKHESSPSAANQRRVALHARCAQDR
jgi:hypothetical protein